MAATIPILQLKEQGFWDCLFFSIVSLDNLFTGQVSQFICKLELKLLL